MKIAVQMHAARNYYRAANPTDAQLDAICGWAASLGFEGLDIGDSWDFEQLSEASATAVRKRVQGHGLSIPSLNCMGRSLCHPDHGEANFKSLMRALQVAAWFGGSIVDISLAAPRDTSKPKVTGLRETPGGSKTASEADFEITIDKLRMLATQAADLGVGLSLELHDRCLADTSATLLRIVYAVAAPNLGVNPDLVNGYQSYDVPVETRQEALKALAPRTNLWHVNNVQRVHLPDSNRAVFLECALDVGDIDYRWSLVQMRKVGFDGWIVVEHKGTSDPFATMARGLRYMRELLEEKTLLFA